MTLVIAILWGFSRGGHYIDGVRRRGGRQCEARRAKLEMHARAWSNQASSYALWAHSCM